jgi:hypothetical protein
MGALSSTFAIFVFLLFLQIQKEAIKKASPTKIRKAVNIKYYINPSAGV